MATVHSTSKARSGRNRLSRSKLKAPQPRHACSATPSIDREALRGGLESHIRTVRDAMFVAITCCDAMRYQNADGGSEIATVLMLYCGNPLSRAIRETGVLLALLEGKADIDPDGEEISSLADPPNRGD